MPQNLAPQMDPVPAPQMKPVDVQTAQSVFPQPQQPNAYYGGKAGAVADIASSLLNGWMTGKYLGEQKKAQKAAQTIGTMKDAVDTAGAAYRSAVESGDQTKIDAAGKVLQQQWDEYNHAREQYVVPQEQPGQKKGVGGKIKGAMHKMFAPESPELYLHSALNASKQIDPRSLYSPSKQDQQQSEYADLELKKAKQGLQEQDREIKARGQWETNLNTPEDKRTPDQKRQIEFYEHEKFGKTKADFLKDDILNTVSSGGQLTDAQRQLGEQMGVIRPQVTSTQIHTVMGKDGKPHSQLIAIGPDAKIVGKPQDLPGVDYVPPDQAELAGRIVNNEVSVYAKLLGKAHPEWDEPTRYSVALGQVAKGTTMDWAMKNQQQDVMNRALLKLLQSHTRTYKDSDGNPDRKLDDEGQALIAHFITPGDDGRYLWNASLGVPESHWFSGDTFGGMTKDQIVGYDKQARSELRAILKEQNRGLADAQIDRMMPPIGFSEQQQGAGAGSAPSGGMTPAPPKPLGSGKDFQQPQAGTYTVKDPSGRVIATDVDENAKRFMERDPRGKGLVFTQNTTPSFGVVP